MGKSTMAIFNSYVKFPEGRQMFMFDGEITCVSITPLCHYGFAVNPGLINPANTAVLLGEYHKKVLDEMTIGGVPQLINHGLFNGLV